MLPFLIIIIAYNLFLSIDQNLSVSHGVISEHRARNSLLCTQNTDHVFVFVTYRSMCIKRISHKVKGNSKYCFLTTKEKTNLLEKEQLAANIKQL